MLIKHPKFRIGDKVKVRYTNKTIPLNGKVIHIFEKFKIPSKKKILKYYGPDIINPKFGRVFGPMFQDRIVIKKDNDLENYVILPMGGYNRYFTLEKLVTCPMCGQGNVIVSED